jgi:hypothetical protein
MADTASPPVRTTPVLNPFGSGYPKRPRSEWLADLIKHTEHRWKNHVYWIKPGDPAPANFDQGHLLVSVTEGNNEGHLVYVVWHVGPIRGALPQTSFLMCIKSDAGLGRANEVAAWLTKVLFLWQPQPDPYTKD